MVEIENEATNIVNILANDSEDTKDYKAREDQLAYVSHFVETKNLSTQLDLSALYNPHDKNFKKRHKRLVLLSILVDDKAHITATNLSNHQKQNQVYAGGALWKPSSFGYLNHIFLTTSNRYALTAKYQNTHHKLIKNRVDKDGMVMFAHFLEIYLVDSKDPAKKSDDTLIIPWDVSQAISQDNVAWIEAHTSPKNPSPRMPQLELRTKGLCAGLSLKASLHVHYTRTNGVNKTRAQRYQLNEDTVTIPQRNKEGKLPLQAIQGNCWKLYNEPLWKSEIKKAGFFGGRATLRYAIYKDDKPILEEQSIIFRIGGKNPDDERCKAYINNLNKNTLKMTFPPYAIARHESKDYNGAGTRYNQFYTFPSNSKENHYKTRLAHVGRPLYGNDSDPPGGYGLFQVTGNAKNRKIAIPREQIWNWQKNVEAAFSILRAKKIVATIALRNSRKDCMRDRKKAIPVPNHSVPRGAQEPGTLLGDALDGNSPERTHFTFTDSTIIDAITIKAYNGAQAVDPGGTTGTGNYCVWCDGYKNTDKSLGRWEFRRWKGIGKRSIKESYVDDVAREIK